MRLVILYTLVILLFSACIKDTGTKCSYDECLKVAPASEQQDVENYLASQGITNWVKHCSGLYYVIDNPGTGDAPDACSQIHVDHTGTLTDGTSFSSGEFTTDMGHLIPGWRNGLPKIKEGGKIRLFIPPTLGYGSEPNPPIPGNSILIFSVDLKAVL